MNKSDTPCLIGVDGGGTSCRVALLRGDQRVAVTLGSANVAVNRDAAIATIRQGLDQVLIRAGMSPADLPGCAVYMGLAGIMSRAQERAVMDAFAIPHLAVSCDRDLAFPGAFGAADGALVAVGTGSFVGRRMLGKTKFIGGWGFVLDDAASGAWLGRNALAQTVRAIDGFQAPGALSDAMLGEFGGSQADLVDFSLTATPGAFAGLAPQVVELAAQGDMTATRLMQSGAKYLADSLAILGWLPGQDLCLLGGMAPHYKPYLAPALTGSIVAPKGTALDGALRLAAGLQQGTRG